MYRNISKEYIKRQYNNRRHRKDNVAKMIQRFLCLGDHSGIATLDRRLAKREIEKMKKVLN
jgi:hypothetical protein